MVPASPDASGQAAQALLCSGGRQGAAELTVRGRRRLPGTGRDEEGAIFEFTPCEWLEIDGGAASCGSAPRRQRHLPAGSSSLLPRAPAASDVRDVPHPQQRGSPEGQRPASRAVREEAVGGRLCPAARLTPSPSLDVVLLEFVAIAPSLFSWMLFVRGEKGGSILLRTEARGQGRHWHLTWS